MESMTAGQPASGAAPRDAQAEAMDFVRFCHRRRRVGWPELYDEMCAVVGRGLYRGYGQDDLATIGIGLGLFQMPALAGLVSQVVAEDNERRRCAAAALQASLIVVERPLEGTMRTITDSAPASRTTVSRAGSEAPDGVAPEHRSIRVAVPAGA